MVVVVVVAASEALSIYTKSGPFVRGKELSEVALPEPPKKRKPPRTPPEAEAPQEAPEDIAWSVYLLSNLVVVACQ